PRRRFENSRKGGGFRCCPQSRCAHESLQDICVAPVRLLSNSSRDHFRARAPCVKTNIATATADDRCRRFGRARNKETDYMDSAASDTRRRPEPSFAELFTPKLITLLREGYSAADFRADALAGLTVAIVALPLSMAIAIGSGLSPEKGLFTAIVGG